MGHGAHDTDERRGCSQQNRDECMMAGGLRPAAESKLHLLPSHLRRQKVQPETYGHYSKRGVRWRRRAVRPRPTSLRRATSSSPARSPSTAPSSDVRTAGSTARTLRIIESGVNEQWRQLFTNPMDRPRPTSHRATWTSRLRTRTTASMTGRYCPGAVAPAAPQSLCSSALAMTRHEAASTSVTSTARTLLAS